MKEFNQLFDAHPSIALLSDTKTQVIVDANQAAVAFYGYSYTSLLSFKLCDLTPDYHNREKGKSTGLTNYKAGHNLFQHILKDGSIKSVDVLIAPIVLDRRKYDLLIIQDITETEKTKRFYAFIARTNDLVLNAKNPDFIISQICQIAVEVGGFIFSWIGKPDIHSGRVNPLSWAGKEDGYLSANSISINPEIPEGQGPASKVFHEGTYYYSNDISQDPYMKPWQKEALQRGYQSGIIHPIWEEDKISYIIAFYSDKKNYFKSEELVLMTQVVGNIQNALVSFNNNSKILHYKERQEQFMRLLDSSTALLSIIDSKNRILYWNKAAIDLFGTTLYNKGHFRIKDIYGIRGIKKRKMAAKAVREKGKWIGENEVIDKNGKTVHLYQVFERHKIGDSEFITLTAIDYTQKVALEKKLRLEKLKEEKLLSTYAMHAQELERNKIGQELHDNVNQILAATILGLSFASRHPEHSQRQIAESITFVQSAIEEIRKISHGLITPDFESGNNIIAGLLKNLFCNIAMPTGLEFELEQTNFTEDLLSNEQKLAVYRIAQEHFSNIVKHAKAKKVTIHLSSIRNRFHMSIEDDGMGATKTNKIRGIGMINIRRRITNLNGHMEIHTDPGKGYRILVEFPLLKRKEISSTRYMEISK